MKLFAVLGVMLTVVCWGSYGPVLHKGQHYLGENRLKPLICVGLAYFVVAIIIPLLILAVNGKLSGDWTVTGVKWSMAAGVAGALGALGIITALTNQGKPPVVMSLVFGFAPAMTAAVTMWMNRISVKAINAYFLLGVVMVGIGAAMVVRNTPKAQPRATAPVSVDAQAVSEST